MRVPAALIALLCCILEGVRRRAALRERAVLLGGITQMLNGFLIEIRCSGATLDELISRAEGRFAEFVREGIESGCDVREAWSRACSRSPKKNAETALLSELGQSLGTSDKDGTIRLLEIYAERFSELEREARDNYSRKGKAWVQVGMLCGIAAAIMII